MNRCENCKCWKDRRFLLVQVTKNVHQPQFPCLLPLPTPEKPLPSIYPHPQNTERIFLSEWLVSVFRIVHWDLEHVHELVVEYSPFYLQPGFVPGSITALVSLLYLFFYAWVFFFKQKLRLIVHTVLINGSPDGALMILMVVTNSLPLPLWELGLYPLRIWGELFIVLASRIWQKCCC